jgi:hypothetical protein
MNTIESKNPAAKIKKMHLLYKMDNLNKISPYAYINGRENVLLCLKTEKGVVIGGFS